MQQLLARWKRPLRNAWKYGQALRHGYPFYYARQQHPDLADRYPYLWSEFTTPIPDRGTSEIRQNRIWNLQLAARQVDYLELRPQQIFSFCDRIGDPTPARGFRAGPVFVRGEVRTDTGGGLCLMATNLFNTYLWAGFQILERHCHSIDAYGDDRFYQLGRDAAISYGYKDLIVRNLSNIALQLRFQVFPDTGKVISRLWGERPRPWHVKIESTVQQEIPPSFVNGISGWIVETTRQIHDRRPDRDGTTNDGTIEEDAISWQLDYRSTSLYQPCANRETNSADTPDPS
jgi:vancomycin resistance protein VanW